jgi:hypothetical protein
MRISSDNKDYGYSAYAYYCMVSLDGVNMYGWRTADEVLGIVVMPDGEDPYGNPKYKTVKGKVAIKPGSNVEIVGGRIRFAKT